MSEQSTGDIVISAVIRAAAMDDPVIEGNSCIFVWKVNASEQIEAALAEAGYKLEKI